MLSAWSAILKAPTLDTIAVAARNAMVSASILLLLLNIAEDATSVALWQTPILFVDWAAVR